MPVVPLPSPDTVATLDSAGGSMFLCYDRTEAEYIGDFNQHVVELGYRVLDVCGYPTSAGTRYSAIFEQAKAGPDFGFALSSDHKIAEADLDSVTANLKAVGMQPLRLSGYVVGGATFYTSIWEKRPGPVWSTHPGQLTVGLEEHAAQARREGFRIVDLCGYSPPVPPEGGARGSVFTSIWEKTDGRQWQVTGPVSAVVYQRVSDLLTGQGWSAVRVSGWETDDTGGPVFIALWERTAGQMTESHHGVDASTLAADLPTRDSRGLRPTQLGGYASAPEAAPSARFCPVWTRRDADQIVPPLVAAFARDNGGVPAVSIAVARHGKLVYSHGYGITDPISGHPVVPANTLFRIASLSKPITSAAIMRLAQRGSLTLDDIVFGPSGYLADFGTPIDPRANRITVRDLLQHASGGWPNDSNDPMYTHPELDATALAKKTIAERLLDHDPATTYAYSNFGYSVLGRVIEKITGVTYEQHLRTGLLADCGITDMHIAGNTTSDRRPGEVLYYGTEAGYQPYTIPVHRMDAHGGWLATAVDLLRFAVRVDGLPTTPDLLDTQWITEMTTVPHLDQSKNYAAGWAVTDGTWSHNGLLAGTTTWLTRTADGYCWAALANTSTDSTITGLNQLMWAIRNRVDFWQPPTDL